jgi:DNA-binding transcriptional MerR regulator
MDPELISKKDLLQLTGISYGQLYRWKRKGLIPEEWFVRKSTFTGQETFFPRDKVIARIERIQSLKEEDISLDDIAEAVTPDLTGVSLSPEEAVARGVISAAALEVFSARRPEAESLRYGELLSAYVTDQLLKTGEVTVDEGALVLATLEEGHEACKGRECDIVLVRKMGVAMCLIAPSTAEIVFDGGAKLLARINLQEATEALGARLK